MSALRRIWRGAGYVEGYGHHPGTPILLVFLALGYIAAETPWGAFVMGLIFGPLWLHGCWMRGGKS